MGPPTHIAEGSGPGSTRAEGGAAYPNTVPGATGHAGN
jgi:hypothetical protein